jgi:hypothetical protein
MKLQAMPLPIAVLLKILNQRIFRPWINIIDKVFARLVVDANVVPGQPIPISVYFTSANPAIDFGTGVKVDVFLDSDPLLHMPSDASNVVPYVVPSLPIWRADIGDVSAVIDADCWGSVEVGTKPRPRRVGGVSLQASV